MFQVLLHGIVVDKKGKKMSKTLGNVINPDDVTKGTTLRQLHARVDDSIRLGYMNDNQAADAKKSLTEEFPNGITECGSDGLRYFLLSYNIQREKINIDTRAMINSRQLGSKIWQISRYAKLAYDMNPIETLSLDDCESSVIERWMLHQTAEMVTNTRKYYDQYELHLVCKCLEEFWMNNFSGIFLECIKPVIYSGNSDKTRVALSVMLTCLRTGLLCSTPIIPYICNALHRRLPKCSIYDDVSDIRQARYPVREQWEKHRNHNLADEMQDIMKTVRIIRDLKQEASGQVKKIFIYAETDATYAQYVSNVDHLKVLTKVNYIEVKNSKPELKQTNVLTSSIHDVAIHAYICAVRDEDVSKRCRNLEMKKLRLEKELAKLETVINNADFQAKAPENVRLRKKQKQLKLKSELDGITKMVKHLKKAL